ncbi:MAG: heme ABC transporter ATP-binding protein [Gammaproteobacteria bacterium]
MLLAQNVSYSTGQRQLLQKVSLVLQPGQVLALVGPNGAGKSTLLKLLVGELQPSAGTVLMNERPLPDWPLSERARQRAVLPQDSTLSFGFTVQEVVLLGRSPYGSGRSSYDYHVAQEALAAAAVEHLAARSYMSLSGGERQRVQLARVLAQLWPDPKLAPAQTGLVQKRISGPRYLLLDEPTASLDLAHQHATLRQAQQLARQRGLGVLAVLHDLNLAAEYADHIALLQQGRLVAQGTPFEVLTPALIEQTFAMSAQIIPHPALNCPLIVPLSARAVSPADTEARYVQ